MAIMEISVSPRGGDGVGLSQYIAKAITILKESGLAYETHSMGTNIEGDISELLAIAAKMHQAVYSNEIKRVVTSIKIDERRDKKVKLGDKVKSVQSKL